MENEKICDECWFPVRDFHDFYNQIKKVHKEQYFLEPEIKFEEENFDEDEIKVESLEAIEKVLNENPIEDVKEKTKTLSSKRAKRKTTKVLTNVSGENENCTKTTNQRDKFLEYEKVIKEHLDIKCPICFMNFDSFSDMISHNKEDHDEVGYLVCCDRKFKKRYEIYKHIMEHKKPPERLICNVCNKKFKNERSLKFHKKEIHTPDEERPYACEKCPRKFTSISVLKQHLICHEGIKKFVCSIPECSQTLASKGALKLHMKIHDGSNDFICDVCSKIIKGKANLEYHKKTHDDNYANEKVQCPICGAWVKSLRKHKRAHSHVQLECNICGKTYPSKESLKTHIKFTHLTGKDFHCSLCDKSFKRERSLKV